MVHFHANNVFGLFYYIYLCVLAYHYLKGLKVFFRVKKCAGYMTAGIIPVTSTTL